MSTACSTSAKRARLTRIRPFVIAAALATRRGVTRNAAGRGVLAAPGDFYGPAGAQHVRVAFTATDERIAAAVERLR